MSCDKLLRPKLSLRKRLFIIIIFVLVNYVFFTNVIFKNSKTIDVHQLEQDNQAQTRSKFDISQPGKFKYVYNPERACLKRHPYLMIVIKSRVDHFVNREILRRTWAQQDEYGLVRRVFTLGLPKPSTEHREMIEAKLRAENMTFGDLVLQDFYDDYYNNTLKTMMGIQWASVYCSKVQQYFLVLFLPIKRNLN